MDTRVRRETRRPYRKTTVTRVPAGRDTEVQYIHQETAVPKDPRRTTVASKTSKLTSNKKLPWILGGTLLAASLIPLAWWAARTFGLKNKLRVGVANKKPIIPVGAESSATSTSVSDKGSVKETTTTTTTTETKMPKVGGLKAVEDINEVGMKIALEVKPQLEAKTGTFYSIYNPLQYATQVVAGTNYFIKVDIGNGQHVHLRVYKDLKGNLTLHSFQAGKASTDLLEYF